MRVKKHIKTSAASFLMVAASVLAGTGVARADWRQDLGVFRIGIIEREALKLSPGELERIRTGYADALTMPVEIVRLRDFPALIDAQVSARVEYAILSAAAYSTAYLLCECVEPLAQPISADASNGTRTVLFMEESIASSPVEKTKGIAVPGKNSLNGFGVPLASENIGSSSIKGDEPWLSFANNADSAVQQYAEGKVDGFFATVSSTSTLDTALQQNALLTSAVLASGRKTKAVWISNPVSSGPHTVRKNLPSEAKKLLSDYLTKLAASDPDLNDILLPANAVRFQPANHNDYATALSATKKLAAHAGQPAE